jgi:hypothetical protein
MMEKLRRRTPGVVFVRFALILDYADGLTRTQAHREFDLRA